MSQAETDIKQLLATYCHRVDRGTPEEVATLFAPEAVLRPRFDGEYAVNGRTEIAGWYAYYNEHLRSGTRHLKHMISSIEIHVDGTRARSCCYFTAGFVSTRDDKVWLAFGTYTDQLVQKDEGWLFVERIIDTHFVVPGIECVEKFPSMGYPGKSG